MKKIHPALKSKDSINPRSKLLGKKTMSLLNTNRYFPLSLSPHAILRYNKCLHSLCIVLGIRSNLEVMLRWEIMQISVMYVPISEQGFGRGLGYRGAGPVNSQLILSSDWTMGILP